ncbi:MAG: tetratricopeptide repeat protein [candidate division NC10 bacterium]|nr:tetratricopeptide repeat protein [candidate division NC10 bacterium]
MEYLLIAILILIALALITLPFWRKATSVPPPPPQGEAEELLLQKATLYQSLRELELDYQMGKLSDEDYQALRQDYEAEAATVLARLDALGYKAKSRPEKGRPVAVAQRQQGAPFFSRPAFFVAFGLLLVVLGAAGGYFLARSSNSKGGGRGNEGQFMPTTPQVAALERRIQENPKDLKALLELAHLHLDQGTFHQSIELYKQVLSLDPRNVEAITHLGIILSKSPHPEQALEVFDKALAIDPNYPHALWDKARVLYDVKQDYQEAIKTWERFLAVAPSGEDADRAREFIQEAKQRLKEGQRAPLVR